MAQLDLKQYLTAWYVQAWIPTKAQKVCATNVITLYAYADGANAFQVATFCKRQDGNTEQWDATGKTDKAGSGKLKLRRLVLLSSPYWVLAVDPGYQWALVGTPNHKKLWVLSKAATITPELLAELKQRAASQGFDSTKLIKTPPNSEMF